MKIHLTLLAIAFILWSCNNSESEKSTNSSSENTDKASGNRTSAPGSNGYWQKMVMHELKDAKGVVAATMPLPASWKLNVNGASMAGPNGIRVTDFPSYTFMMNYDPGLQYAYSQTKMREMPGIVRLIQEDFVPSAAKKGLQYVRHYEIPEISKIDRWYSDQLYKAMPAEYDVRAYGSEWKDDKGKLSFLLIRVNTSTSSQLQTWYYRSSMLEAEPAAYELAKKQYVFSQANMRYNIEPIMEYNKQEMQRVGQNWAAFNKKMAANQAAFEASQIAHINKSNAVNDAIMSGWKARNTAGDKNQEQFIDNIYENEKVQNTETGKVYKVQQGANQYWMNNDGEYIGTRLQDYNPNFDENMNQQKWQELKKVD